MEFLALQAAADADADGLPLFQDSPPNRCVVALDMADLRCRARTGCGLRITADYMTHRGKGDPHVSWIVKSLGGGSWPTALAEAGIGIERYLEPVLMRSWGARTRPGRGEQWSVEEAVEVFALSIERNHGYCPTKDQWEYFRDIVGFETPSYPTLASRHKDSGREPKMGHLDWFHALACEFILADPARFPRSTTRLELVAEVRAEEARRAKANQTRSRNRKKAA
jgi:hypothetical protein